MLDENEFLSPYGLRSLSRYHADHPYAIGVGGQVYRVSYLPAESDTGMFGGNSNWRRPIEDHPEYYIPGTEMDLARAPQNYTRVQRARDDLLLAHGRDPYFPGWPDTLQLNYGGPATQEAMIGELTRIAGQCDGVRCDMAMLVLPEVFERTRGLQSQPFWPRATERVRSRAPDFCFMAEVYWDLEWTLQRQGFDYTYDKRLYDRLRDGHTRPVREHLYAGLDYQSKMARFLENHDEPRAGAAFASGMHEAAAVITFLAPGLRFFHQGQFEGRKKRISPHLGRGPNEPVDATIRQFYDRLLAVLREPVVRDGDWQLLTCLPAWDGNWTCDCRSATWPGGSGGWRIAWAPRSMTATAAITRPAGCTSTCRRGRPRCSRLPKGLAELASQPPLSRQRAAVLAAALLLAVVQPLTAGLLGEQGSFDVFFSLLIGAVLLLVFEEREQRRTAISAGIAAFLAVWPSHGVGGWPGRLLLVGGYLLAAGFFIFALYGILRAILVQRPSGDAVFGAVCGYLLPGIIWTVLFSALETASPGSFHVSAAKDAAAAAPPLDRGTLSYYSFITLATVGYGDVTPTTPMARTLAWMEAVTGQSILRSWWRDW